MLKDRKYKYNQTILKKFSNGEDVKYKLCTLNTLRTSGVEDEADKGKKCSVNDEKTLNNIYRTKSRIFELAFCNKWQWFFTATLDPSKYDRSDLDKFHKTLTQWLRNYNKAHDVKIRFLLIPELHSDGKSWHMHGLLDGLPDSHLKQFVLGDKMSSALAKKVKEGQTLYNWLPYLEKFGFCDIEPVRSHEAVSKYITKYISKSLHNSVKELNAHMYYCSRGLNRAEIIKKGTMFADIVPDYENEYCKITWLDETHIDQIINSIIP